MRKTAPKGMTLIEVVIGLVLVAATVVVFGSSLSAASYSYQQKLRNMASALADEELAALQAVGATAIPVQTNGPILGVLFTQGTWGVVADGTAPSSPNALETTTSSTSSGVTSLMLLPNNAYNDFTLSAKMKVMSGAPAGWKMGLIFRSNDLNNLYQVYLTNTNLKVDKIVSGTNTNLYSDARSISANTWQTIQVVATGSSLTITLNGISVTTITDTSLTIGKAALAVWGGANAHFDDVVIGGVTSNMDTTTIGTLPTGWDRFGLSSLPNGAASLTASTLYSDSSFKSVNVTISWTDRSGTKSVTESSYVRN